MITCASTSYKTCIPPLLWVCVCVFVCMCMCTRALVCTCLWTSVDVQNQPPSLFCLTLLRLGLSVNPELSGLASLTSPLALGMPCLCPLRLEVWADWHPHTEFTQILEIWTLIASSLGKSFNLWALPPAPQLESEGVSSEKHMKLNWGH